MAELHSTASVDLPERALLVAVQRPREPAWEVQDALDELAQLSASAGVVALERRVFRQRAPHAALFIGAGQADALAERVRALGAHTVIFDEDLTPVQGRNLEQRLGARAVDRTQVILDIFAQRAHTSEGRLQIELAQLEYLRPRLRRLWTHLERQKGGIGLKGPGEQQLELDRRRLDLRIDRIRSELERVRARRGELRRGRARHGWALVALVGYTNAGKSTLLNRLADARVYADDRLFATLDPTTRRIALPNRQPALLTDTVGFIRKLPHDLVDAFRATLEEVTQADLLVHVIDAAHPRVDAQIAAVGAVLGELGAGSKPMVHALNKTDLPAATATARRLAAALPRAVPISAATGEGLDAFRAEIADALQDRRIPVALRLPLTEGRRLAEIRRAGRVESLRYAEDGIHVEARVPPALAAALAEFADGEASGWKS